MNKKAAFINFAALTVAGLVSQGAFAADGQINFTGQIVDTPCSIAPSSQNLTVPLGNVARSSLNGTVGKKSTPAKFTINLTGCGATAVGAKVTFTGTADTNDATVLKLANAGTVGTTASAAGVAVEIEDSTGAKIALGAQSASYALGAGDNALQFQAAYVATQPAVTSGPANATAQFTVAYN
ncbi:fimbrial protein [Variovorax sp. OV329]|uniref:fimbrial protein n=1 Tax=Variovorax sp. OV329 TaxID=1882825 RepID=UPI0008E00D79|nr:fimbrial protein [Variovorax sp. OV329]SFM97135.1 major type 1 subunit fimbrin (pilin) [Variovorax sp. OV329]